MKPTARKHLRSLLGIGGGIAGLLLCAASADAAGPVVLKLAKGTGGGYGEYGGPGNEQPALTSYTKDGKQYVIVTYMSSDVEEGLGPWQCKCTSLELSADKAPTILADQVYLTKNGNSDRPCNHPAIINDGKRAIWTWGYAENGGSTETYVQGIDEMCQPVTDVVRVSNNNGNNNGAPDLIDAGSGYLVVGYYSNGDQQTYVRGVSLQEGGGLELSPTFRKTVVTPSNIGRPTMAVVSADRALVCAAQGDNRPPEDGVACTLFNPMDGTVYWSEIVAASQPGQKIYMNQPSLAKIGPGRFALETIESSGQGKNTNVKGGSKAHIYILEPSDIGPNVRAHQDGIGVYQTHSAVFAGAYGQDGRTFLAHFEAAITGSGVPAVTFASYDSAAQKLLIDTVKDQWVVGPTMSDSGYLANIYGANPNTQGRDFMRAISNVPNPGDGVEGGFMPEVKSFWVLPYAGMDGSAPEEDKNALFVSFVPGHTNVPVDPESPTVVEPGSAPPPPSDPTTTSSTGSGSGATSSSSGGNGATDDPSNLGSTAPSGCACEAAGSDAPSSGIASMMALGLAALVVARRNRS